MGENLNLINQWGEPQKGGGGEGGDQIFKVQWGGGKQKEGGEYNFWLKFSGGKTLEETMLMFKENLCSVSILSSPLNQIWWWVRISTLLFTKIAIIREYLLNLILKSSINHLTNVRYGILKKLIQIIPREPSVCFLGKGLSPT